MIVYIKICNNKKVDNDRTFTEGYVLSYPARVGGAVAINAGGAIYNYRTLNIYGGLLNANTSSDSGGAIYMANSILRAKSMLLTSLTTKEQQKSLRLMLIM